MDQVREPNLTTLDRTRFRAALLLLDKPLTGVAADAGISLRHLELVLRGHRPLSSRLAAALAHALGSEAWAFATGRTDTMAAAPAAGGRHAA